MTEPNVHLKFGIGGRYKLDVLGPDGEFRRSTGWFNNLVLTNGLDLLGSLGSINGACQVGLGSSTPVATQTGLDSYVAGTTNIISSTTTAQSTSPYYIANIRTWQFTPAALGNVAHNFSEVGVGASTANDGKLFSRQLILDGLGSPTTITVLGDEYLNVTYELRYYPPASDVTATVTINSTSYTITIRAALVTSSGTVNIGTKAGFYSSGGGSTWFQSAVQPITSIPSGAGVGALSSAVSSYTNGNYYVDLTASSVINTAITGIQSYVVATTFGYVQMGISPPIDKTNTQQLTFVTRVSWANHPL